MGKSAPSAPDGPASVSFGRDFARSKAYAVRFPIADRAHIALLAKAGGFSGFSAYVRHATYLLAEKDIAARAAEEAASAMLWSFADVSAAEKLGTQVRRVGTNLNQLVRAVNYINAAIDEGGDVAHELREGLPRADEAADALAQVRAMLKDLNAFVAELKARVPARKDRRTRGAATDAGDGSPA